MFLYRKPKGATVNINKFLCFFMSESFITAAEADAVLFLVCLSVCPASKIH